MATVEDTLRMAEGIVNELPPFPEGVHAMKCESDGKLYVINEILNFYQRKLSNLTAEAVKLCAHHLFKLEEIHQAKSILLKLWNWKKCQPSTENTYIIKGLGTKRQGQNGKKSSADDIINFLNVEDANLDIIFLTLKCEKIPSKVTESQAMKDIYVLMHESDSNYQRLLSDFNDKTEEIQNYTNLVTDLRGDMSRGFETIYKMLRDLPALNNVATAVRGLNADDNNVNVGESATGNDMATGVQSETTNIANLPTHVDDGPNTASTDAAAAETIASNVSGTLVITEAADPITEEEDGNNAATVSNSTEDELEPGEIPDEDGLDNISEASFTSAAEGQSNENPWFVAGVRHRINNWWNTPRPQQHHPQQPQQHQYQQHLQQQQHHPQQPQQHQYQQHQQQQQHHHPQQPQQQHQHHQQQQQPQHQNTMPRRGSSTERPGNRLSKSAYVRNNSRNIIRDEGENDIPFQASTNIHKYALFITNIALGTDVNVMKQWLSRKLNADVVLKSMSREGAQCLSFGLFFNSEHENLNMKMPGLWPMGTEIYKWVENREGLFGTRRNGNGRNNSRGGFSARGQYHQTATHVAQNHPQGQGQHRPGAGNFSYKYHDQQRLHAQYV